MLLVNPLQVTLLLISFFYSLNLLGERAPLEPMLRQGITIQSNHAMLQLTELEGLLVSPRTLQQLLEQGRL